MLSAKTGKLYRDFYDRVRDESILDRKTTILLGLAAAMTSGCSP